MTEKEKIAEKIRKLLALSKSSNQHEAEAAMAKANELMQEYQITYSTVIMQDLHKEGVIEGSTVRVSETWRSFVVKIARASAMLFDCEAIKTHEQSEFFFVGAKEDIVNATILFDHLFAAWKSVLTVDTGKWKEEWVRWEDSQPRQYEVKKYQISHGQGFAGAVLGRASALVRDRKAAVKASGAKGTALVVLKDQLVKHYMDTKTVDSKSRYKRQAGGYSDGVRAGNNVVINTAIGDKT